jgi:uncharacterized membrane protein
VKVTDRSIERSVSVLLMAGVIIAGSVTLLGAVVFLTHHWNDTVNFRTFHSQPRVDRIITEIVTGAFSGRARSIIQLGMLLLIATPVARVAFSLFGFAMERDRTYVATTTIVLLVLLYSLISGAISG